MNYTFSIHGVPYGSQAWGDINDSEYLKSFYNSVSATNVPTQMIVDIRYLGNTICSYYHYLILSNVDDYESRPGSYFGMTICFAGVFCSDFVELYKLFDACFKKVTLNSILVKTGERYKYVIDDFDSVNNTDILKRVDRVVRKNIHLFEHNLVEFPENFSPKHRDDGWIEKWSIDDVGNKTFVNILLRDSMKSISPYYPVSYKKVEILQVDNRTKDSKIKTLESDNGNLQSENEGLKTKISNQKKDIESQGTTIKYQNGVIDKQKGSIATLETEKTTLENNLKESRRQVEALKEELKQAQNNRDDETLKNCIVTLKSIAQKRAHTDQLIDAINPRLKKVEENIEQIDNQLNKKRTFKFTQHHFQVGALIVVTIIAVAGIILPNHSSDGGILPQDIATKGNVKEMIDNALSPITRSIRGIQENVEDIKSGGSVIDGDSNSYDGNEVSFIDIQGDGSVKRGKKYTLTAKKGKKPYQSLKIGGGKFFIQLNDSTKISIPSTDNGKTASLSVDPNWTTFNIIYCVGNNIIKSRPVSVSE